MAKQQVYTMEFIIHIDGYTDAVYEGDYPCIPRKDEYIQLHPKGPVRKVREVYHMFFGLVIWLDEKESITEDELVKQGFKIRTHEP